MKKTPRWKQNRLRKQREKRNSHNKSRVRDRRHRVTLKALSRKLADKVAKALKLTVGPD